MSNSVVFNGRDNKVLTNSYVYVDLLTRQIVVKYSFCEFSKRYPSKLYDILLRYEVK